MDQSIPDGLRFIWEQYFQMIGMMITLITAVLAFLAGLTQLKIGENLKKFKLFKSTILFLASALVLAFLWRIFAEVEMEREILGDLDLLDIYFVTRHSPDVYRDFKGLDFWDYRVQYLVAFFKISTISCFTGGVISMARLTFLAKQKNIGVRHKE